MKDLIESILDCADLSDVIDKVTALNIRRSCEMCINGIVYARKQIAEEGSKQYLVQDIEDAKSYYTHLAHCYMWYTGECLPTVEQRLKSIEQSSVDLVDD